MKIVSPILKRVVYPSLSSLGFFRSLSQTGLAVVTYHGVLPRGYDPVDPAFDGNLIAAETLRRQLRLLKSHYTVVTPDRVLAWREGSSALPPKAVLVTCDDGLLNNLTEMLPILQEEEVQCLFFVTGVSAGEERRMLWYEELFLLLFRAPTGRMRISLPEVVVDEELASREQRRSICWSLVKRLSQIGSGARETFLDGLRSQLRVASRQYLNSGSGSCERFGLMTRSELRALAAAGMTIGAHTMSHPMLSQAPLNIAQSEIAESRRHLETALQRSVWALAYPFGDAQSVTPEVLAIPQTAGYKAAFLNYGGGLGVELPANAIPRIHVTSEMSLAELDAHVSGFYARLRRGVGQSD